MLRFHVNQRPDENFIEVKKRVQICHAVQIDESFEVGTSNGVAHGKAGDYLFMDGSALSVVREEDFDTMYELVKSKEVKKKEKVEEKTPEKKVAKKSSKEIYQKPKEVKKVVKKAVKPTVKKKAKTVNPVTKKVTTKKRVVAKKKK